MMRLMSYFGEAKRRSLLNLVVYNNTTSKHAMRCAHSPPPSSRWYPTAAAPVARRRAGPGQCLHSPNGGFQGSCSEHGSTTPVLAALHAGAEPGTLNILCDYMDVYDGPAKVPLFRYVPPVRHALVIITLHKLQNFRR